MTVEAAWSRLNAIVAATGVGTWEWDVQTGTITSGEMWPGHLGYARAEIEPLSLRKMRALIHPDDTARVDALMAQHLAGTTEVFDCELRMRHREGSWVWLHVHARVMDRTPAGKPHWIFGMHQDITGRRRQTDALRKSQDLLRRTGSLAGIGGWEYDVTTQQLSWSDETCAIHGVADGYRPTVEEALSFYAPEARPRIFAAFSQCVESGERYDLELPFVRADGERIWVRSVGSAEIVDGAVTRLTGAIQDVSQRVIERDALRVANERVALATDAGGIGIWERDLVTGGAYWNERMYRLYGLEPGAGNVDLDQWRRAIHRADLVAVDRAFADAIANRAVYETEYRIVWPDGNVRHLRSSGRVVRDANARAVRFVGVNWDITEARRLGAELAAQHERLRVTLQSIGDAVITTNADGSIVWLNPVAEQMTGWTIDEAVGRRAADVFRVVHEETRDVAPDPVERFLHGADAPSLAAHAVLLSRDGTEYGIEESAAPIRNDAGELLGIVLIFHDVTEARRLSGEMRYRALHDALTGLVNRAEVEHRLRRLVQRAHDDRSEHALLFIDLDDFKVVNDTCGHAAGDALLVQIAKLIGNGTRSRDTLGRLGGDEFAVILDHCSVDEAQRVAGQICERIDRYRYIHAGRPHRVGASIGVAPINARSTSAAAVLAAADAACYAAKRAGRNRVHIALDTKTRASAQREMQWIARLHHALENNLFVLFGQCLQPLSRPYAGGVSAEVLLRLIDTDGSLVAPSAFLPAAERAGIAVLIDRWVLTRTVVWLQRHEAAHAVDLLSVNLSHQAVGDHAFHAWALATLAEAGPAVRSRLCIELAETAAVSRLGDATPFVEALRRSGVRVALDSFGASASSFGYLNALPVDLLKIDGNVVRGLLDDRLKEISVRCFVAVAAVIDAQTVAACVDSPGLAARLHALGVDFAQGYRAHRPEPLDALLAVRPLAVAE